MGWGSRELVIQPACVSSLSCGRVWSSEEYRIRREPLVRRWRVLDGAELAGSLVGLGFAVERVKTVSCFNAGGAVDALALITTKQTRPVLCV